MPPLSSPGLPPGYEFGYDQITSAVNITSTNSASPTTIITCAEHWFDGKPVLAEIYCPGWVPSASVGDFLGVSLWEGSTDLGLLILLRRAQTAVTDYEATPGLLRFTPTAGMHSYLVKAYVSANNNASASAGAGGAGTTCPAFVRFTKI